MKKLYVDIETFSGLDIRRVPVYAYSEDPKFDILMAAFAYDDDPVEVLIGEEVRELQKAIARRDILKIAHGAIFERICFSRYFGLPTGQYIHPEPWKDTQALAAEYGYPQRLKDVAKALGASPKDEAGTLLINFFCKPNRKGQRNRPEDHPEKWAKFVEYCRQDVVSMRDVERLLPDGFPTEDEHQIWITDQLINDRGIRLDLPMAASAKKAAEMNKARHMNELRNLTGLENPNSPTQLLGWLQDSGLKSMKNLKKETVSAKLATLAESTTEKAQRVHRVLELRQEIALTASSKFSAALESASPDGRLRGQFRFFGAHTGRWSGRKVQLHNLPRLGIAGTEIEALGLEDEEALALYELRLQQVLDRLELIPFAEPHELKGLVRPMFFLDGVVVDFNAIEARVLAWLAGEEWVLQAFREGRDIYVETATRMSTPTEPLTRSQGKVAVLALGYNGGVNSLRAMGYGGNGERAAKRIKLGLERIPGDMTDAEVRPMVGAYRAANPAIVQFWADLGEAFNYGGQAGRIEVRVDGDSRYVVLPSGRAICYHGVTVNENFYVFDEELQRRVKKKATRFDDPRWVGSRTHTYGGRLAENVTQAVARDLLGQGLVNLTAAGVPVVGHVHDEVLTEGVTDWEEVSQIFCETPAWAEGLPVAGAGFYTHRYRKD